MPEFRQFASQSNRRSASPVNLPRLQSPACSKPLISRQRSITRQRSPPPYCSFWIFARTPFSGCGIATDTPPHSSRFAVLVSARIWAVGRRGRGHVQTPVRCAAYGEQSRPLRGRAPPRLRSGDYRNRPYGGRHVAPMRRPMIINAHTNHRGDR